MSSNTFYSIEAPVSCSSCDVKPDIKVQEKPSFGDGWIQAEISCPSCGYVSTTDFCLNGNDSIVVITCRLGGLFHAWNMMQTGE